MNAPAAAEPRARPGRWKVWVRSVHLYASLFGLVGALFFGTTGFLLNHEAWFEVPTVTREVEGALPSAVLPDREPLAVVEAVRAEFELAGGLSAYEVEDDLLRLRFERPGEVSDVEVERDGRLHLIQERSGLFQTLTDLHKGDGSGWLGKRLIDVTSLLLILISLSGLVLWLTLPKRRRLGLVALGFTAGLLLIFALYVFR